MAFRQSFRHSVKKAFATFRPRGFGYQGMLPLHMFVWTGLSCDFHIPKPVAPELPHMANCAKVAVRIQGWGRGPAIRRDTLMMTTPTTTTTYARWSCHSATSHLLRLLLLTLPLVLLLRLIPSLCHACVRTMHARMRAHTHACKHVHARAHTQTCAHTCPCSCTHKRARAHARTLTRTLSLIHI